MSVGASFAEWRLACRLALREMRGGLKGFRIFALALALGVAAVAGIGSLAQSFRDGLEDQKRALLGGDFEVTSIGGPVDAATDARLAAVGRTSRVVDAQLMARAIDGSGQSVVMLKGVDAAWPLEGAVRLRDGAAFAPILTSPAGGGDPWPAAVDQTLLDRLGIARGGLFAVGSALFRADAVIAEEPDRASAGFLLGPRLLVSDRAAAATGLLDRSALVNRHVRVVAASPEAASAFLQRESKTLQGAGLRVRTAADAARGLERLLRNLTIFFTMIGLSSLAIGGIGAANAVDAYLARKTPAVATLKCLGATGSLVLQTYLVQVLLIAAFAALVGVAVGAAIPFLVAGAAADRLPFDARLSLYPAPLAEAAGFGLIAALAFAWLPLARARRASPAELFRNVVEPAGRATAGDFGVALAFGAAFLALAVMFAGDRRFALTLAATGFGAWLALRLLVGGLVLLGRRLWRPARGPARIAAANLFRRGSSAGTVAVSLGLGLTLLATVSIIDANLSRNLNQALPSRAPGLFFSDIPYADADRFDAEARALGRRGGSFERYYMLRAGIAAIKGVPTAEAKGARRSPWARDNDWGVTILKTLPKELGVVTAGAMWRPDYAGPPLLALSDWQAKIFELKPGDEMSLSVSGRVVTARIAALYKQDWERGGLNFVAAFAPGTLEAARPSSVASLRMPDIAAEDRAARRLAAAFPTTAIIRTREVVESVARTLRGAGLVVRLMTGVVVASGVVVLLGAIAAAFARKLRDAMILKTVGASRARILAAEAIEYAALGLAPALAAVALGAVASWQVVRRNMDLEWFAPWGVIVPLVFGAAAATLALGLAAARLALAARPWPVLRSP